MARKVKVDFTGVESFQRVSEGIHTVKIAKIDEKTSQGGDPMLQVAFEVLSGDDKGNKVFDSLSLGEKALWKFKSLLQCIGMKCDGKVAVDLDNMVGKVLDVNVVHEEYNGVTRARISEFSKVTSKGSVDDDDIDDDDIDDEEEEETPKAKKADKKPAKKSSKKEAKKPEPEEDDDEDDDWDEEEEEEEAPKKKTPAKKTSAKKGKKKPEPEEEEDDDDDDDWEED